ARSTDVPHMLEGLGRFRDLAGDKRAVAANLDSTRPDAADVLAALAEAGFDDATVIVPHHDLEQLERARQVSQPPALPRIRSLMMCCWIWLVPSKIVVNRASRQCRSTWRSVV